MSRWVYHSEAEFTATHALTRYLGEPESPHNHRWRVAIKVGADTLNDEHYSLDFHAVHQALSQAVAPLDQTSLNLHPEIAHPSPTAESVALFLAGSVRGALENLGGTLMEISVWEGPGNRVDLKLTGENSL